MRYKFTCWTLRGGQKIIHIIDFIGEYQIEFTLDELPNLETDLQEYIKTIEHKFDDNNFFYKE